MARGFTVVAIICAHNEVDIIVPVIGHLIAQGVSVYLLDHGSTDGTARAAERFLGQGLLAIQPFPAGRVSSVSDAFRWEAILARKTELSAELDADWFIHHDADECRESPWASLTLREAIYSVDRFGYNAIDFELFNFWPTDDCFRPGDDPRTIFRYYEAARHWDKHQVKCWKKQDAAADLVSSGGHHVSFPGQRIFPLRFILRHYPIRSQEHGARKVFVERRPRLLPAEIERGWHVQYGGMSEGQTFVRDPSTLVEYHADAARLSLVLRHRDVEALESELVEAANRLDVRDAAIALANREVDRLSADLGAARTDLGAARTEVEAQRTMSETRLATIERLVQDVSAEHDLVERLLRDVDSQRRDIDALRSSKSWRWSAPLRALIERVKKMSPS